MAEATVPSLDWLRKRLEEADPDLLRSMVETLVATLMSAEADAACGAAYGARQAERTNRRNGYRERGWDTRLGTIPHGDSVLAIGNSSVVTGAVDIPAVNGLPIGVDQSLERRFDQFRDPAAEDDLLPEEIGLGLLFEGGLQDPGTSPADC